MTLHPFWRKFHLSPMPPPPMVEAATGVPTSIYQSPPNFDSVTNPSAKITAVTPPSAKFTAALRQLQQAWGQQAWGQQDFAAMDATQQNLAAAVMAEPSFVPLLNFLLDHSSFLSEIWLSEPEFVLKLLSQGPDHLAADLFHTLSQALPPSTHRATTMQMLRRAKRQMALLVALADICAEWELDKITHTLSQFAEQAVTIAACQAAMAMQYPQTAGETFDPDLCAAATQGLIILGMGKLGARELNYSSDIDLIILFDPERVPPPILALCGRKSLGEIYIALARDVVKILSEVTQDGYVFRTDLRLRPDPASTPLALSVRAAEIYYESVGQNWERAAMIKARPVGGDLVAGAEFLQRLRPFIWRKHLDFAAIADIYSLRRQIHQRHRPQATPSEARDPALHLRGFNLKLGPGGIREIEFFAQTQQLVWGGRMPHLRQAGTVAAITQLTAANLCDQATADHLIAAYHLLRQTEHRLQMIDDQQTQTLPKDDAALDDFARFMFCADFAGLAQRLQQALDAVAATGEQFFAHESALSLENEGNLVFTGSENDPDTLQSLAKLGFAAPDQIAHTLRGWHHGRIRATNTTRAREILTELTPTLLKCLAQTPEPDQSFARFDRFLANLPSGVDLFSLLRAKPHLLELLALIMGSAPILAEQLSSMPSLLDSLVMAGGQFSALAIQEPSQTEIEADLRQYCAEATSYEEFLDRVRRWSAEQRFQLGLAVLEHHLAPPTASQWLSRQADAVVTVMIEQVLPYFVASQMRLKGGDPNPRPVARPVTPPLSPPVSPLAANPPAHLAELNFAVLGYGKLGAQELTLDSDLDLVFVFDSEDQNQNPPPNQALPAGWYSRFCQRLIAALTTQTASGGLYRVDMRLRPDGDKGSIIAHFEGFADYHRHQAWLFERMAMTRARVVYAPPRLRDKINQILLEILTRPESAAKIHQAVSSMRRLIAQEHPPRHALDLKYRAGGLIDIEFMTQYWLLQHATAARPIFAAWLGLVPQNSPVPVATPPGGSATRHALTGLPKLGLVDRQKAAILADAHQFFSQCQFLLRVTLGEGWRGEMAQIPTAVRTILVTATHCPDWSHLQNRIDETCQQVMAICQEIN